MPIPCVVPVSKKYAIKGVLNLINNTPCAFGPKFVNCYFDELDFENLTWL
jgi:hypothetical protein